MPSGIFAYKGEASIRMNDIYCIYIDGKARGLDYNPMYKFNSLEDFLHRVQFNEDVPGPDEIVVEAWRTDNLIIKGMKFKDAAKQIKDCFDIENSEDAWDTEY